MLADPFPHASTTPPSDTGATTAAIVMYVEDVDAIAVKKAVDEGATITEEVNDKQLSAAPLRRSGSR